MKRKIVDSFNEITPPDLHRRSNLVEMLPLREGFMLYISENMEKGRGVCTDQKNPR